MDLGVGVGLVGVGLEDLGNVLEFVERTSQVRPSNVALLFLDTFKLEVDL